MDSELQEKYNLQTNDLYRAYGQFAIDFEQMCRNMKLCIIFIMHNRGLTNQELTRVLLADQTAAPLISKLRAFIAIFYKNNPEEINHVEPLFKFCLSINEKRNEIIHGNWFIGWTSSEQTEFDTANGMKDKITKKGVELKKYDFTISMFDDLTEKVRTAGILLDRLKGCIVGDFLPTRNLDKQELDKLNLV